MTDTLDELSPRRPARTRQHGRGASSRVERERRRRVRDRRGQLAVVAVAVVCATLAAISNSPRGLFMQNDQTETANGPLVVQATLRTTLTLLTTNTRIVRFGLLSGIDPKTEQATAVFLPAATVIEIPALGLQPLTNLLQTSDITATATNIANALGVRIDEAVVVNDSGLAKALATTPNISVSVADAVTVDDGAAILVAGENEIASSVAAQLIGGRESGGSLGHFATVQAVLAGWFTALRAQPERVAAAAKIRGVAALASLSGYPDTLQFNTLPVASVAAGDTERYEMNESEAAALFNERFGPAQFGKGSKRARLELLNGVGTPGLVQLVANRVVPAGGHVVLTGNSVRFGQRTTKVVYYRDTDAPFARSLARMLGEGVVAKDASPVSVVDITIVIGADLANKLKR